MSYPSLVCRRHKGFTLVELLVVIGIIAVLISILLPSLSRAREQGNRVKCLSNLKQIGLGVMMYANENKQWFPRAAADGERPDDFLHWQKHRNKDDSALTKYMGDRHLNEEVFRCPSDQIETHINGANAYRYSYTMNEFMGGLRPPSTNTVLHTRIKIVQVKRPAEKILFIDESSETLDDGCWAPQNYASDGKNILSNRHDRKVEKSKDKNAGFGNALFTDFHADTIEREKSTRPEWYDPDVN